MADPVIELLRRDPVGETAHDAQRIFALDFVNQPEHKVLTKLAAANDDRGLLRLTAEAAAILCCKFPNKTCKFIADVLLNSKWFDFKGFRAEMEERTKNDRSLRAKVFKQFLVAAIEHTASEHMQDIVTLYDEDAKLLSEVELDIFKDLQLSENIGTPETGDKWVMTAHRGAMRDAALEKLYFLMKNVKFRPPSGLLSKSDALALKNMGLGVECFEGVHLFDLDGELVTFVVEKEPIALPTGNPKAKPSPSIVDLTESEKRIIEQQSKEVRMAMAKLLMEI